MAKESTEFVLNSLRGRILVAVGALVVFNCFCGLLSYLAVSFVSAEPLYAIIACVAAMVAATAGFGWWLSSDVLRPIDAVSLLARSLERSPSVSLPKTTGASETDELLRTLHRNSQQLQNLIGLMDDVAGGKTEAAMAPLQNPDRLSVSFQKLVSKVTESIKAKQQLDAIQSSVNRLKADVAGVRNGNLSVEFRGDMWQVGEIAEAFKYLLGRTNELIIHASSGSAAARAAAEDIRKSIRKVIESEESNATRLKKVAEALTCTPERQQQLADELETAIVATSASFDAVNAAPEGRAAAISSLRRHLADSKKRLEKLRAHAALIPQTARSAQELGRRSNLVALNTSVQAVGNNGSTALLADEIASLSERAHSVGKEIIVVNDSLSADLIQLEASFASIALQLTEITAAEALEAETNSALRDHLKRFSTVHLAIAADAGARSAEYASVVNALGTNSNLPDMGVELQESERSIDVIANLADSLQEAVSGFRTASGFQPIQVTERLSGPTENQQVAGDN